MRPRRIPKPRLAVEFFDGLDHKRGQWHGIEGFALVHFRCSMRGGDSEVAKSRPRYDVWQGQTKRTGEAKAWCEANGLQTTMKFPLRMGRAEAYCLAKAWAERMEFLYLSSTEGLLATPELARETLQGYQESADFQALASHENEEVKACVARVRGLSCV